MTVASPIFRLQERPEAYRAFKRLLHYIQSHRLGCGDLLPPQPELCRKLGLCNNTFNAAMGALVDAGVVTRKKRVGTAVVDLTAAARARRVCTGTVLVACAASQFYEGNANFALSRMLQAVESELAEGGLGVQLMILGRNPDAERARLEQAAAANNLEAVLAIGNLNDAMNDLPPHLPRVHCGTDFEGLLPWIGDDTRTIARRVTDHLIEHGHRRIALICGTEMTRIATELTERGYRDAFAAAGLRSDERLLHKEISGELLASVIRKLLTEGSLHERPTAIFAANWVVCRAVLTVAAELGLRVPEDFSLASYGLNVLHFAGPEITAWVPDYDDCGRRLGQMLRDLISGEPAAVEPIVLDGALREGRSVRSIAE